MAHADDIQHCCHMVAANADILRGVLVDDVWGYLLRLEKAAQSGGFATRETTEISNLKQTVEELRALADRIVLVKESLVLNSHGA